MVIGACTVYMTAEWVFSLKDKRMIVKSIIEKARHKFNISIAEVDRQRSEERRVGKECL